MQVGCAWAADNLITLALSGDISYLDTANPSRPRLIVKVRMTDI
jgi:hypothetical protein